MYSLWRFLMMGLVRMAVWLAIGLGVGLWLHQLVPTIDLGRATFIGVVTLGGCLLWLRRISTLEALYSHDDREWSEPTQSTAPQPDLRPARRKRRRRSL